MLLEILIGQPLSAFFGMFDSQFRMDWLFDVHLILSCPLSLTLTGLGILTTGDPRGDMLSFMEAT
jgi:hypothetical protein